MNDVFMEVRGLLSQMSTHVKHMETTVKDNLSSCQRHEEEFEALKASHTETIKENIQLKRRIKELEGQIISLVEENKSFMKVSQLIAYEKENAKLRQQLATLTETLEKVRKEEDEEVTVSARKINKKWYYVSDDQNMIIYENNDGEVGAQVGNMILVNGNLKAVFK